MPSLCHPDALMNLLWGESDVVTGTLRSSGLTCVRVTVSDIPRIGPGKISRWGVNLGILGSRLRSRVTSWCYNGLQIAREWRDIQIILC